MKRPARQWYIGGANHRDPLTAWLLRAIVVQVLLLGALCLFGTEWVGAVWP